ncbi:hypothetical protein [Trueperella bernardiae]|uniref:Uncharacterized protein n=1 Tax=Trueperella bernardiae TaxID=59561 RepID=A0A0W1KIZ3_9ACTO|nr:hypothetical protein [Trueperella bernardiae]KTF03928.1 hypothetical protein AQZ59_01258 [Trueperella bernardiae]MCM3907764.1 hypothetical protein [Trueperella bernardiae]OCW60125.1 hypothetical protein AKG36_06475 [Trueperella bernardiae]PKZ88665.1 hypothetical protein CYK24_07435 [Trueperella bernardiae]WIM07158.1 hypothetical protein QPC17_05175 [Trueperella bernardiae]
MNRDYVVYTILALVIGIPLIYTGITLFSKKSGGTWDEASRLKGAMRAQGWRVKDTVDNLALFLLDTTVLPSHWPLAVGAPGVEAVSSGRRGTTWRAGSFVAPSVGGYLLFTLEVPLRSDGTEPEIPETLARLDGGLSWEGESGWVNDDVAAFLTSWPGLRAAHLTANKVTFMVNEGGEKVERLKEIASYAEGIIPTLPGEVWG